MAPTEIITQATEAVTEIVTEAVTEAIPGAIGPEYLDPIYSALWNIQTLNVAMIAVVGLTCGVLLGTILWRWLR